MAEEQTIHPTALSRFDQIYVTLTRDQRIHSGSLDEGLRSICETCVSALNISNVSVWEMNPAGTLLQCLVLFDATSGRIESGHELPVTELPEYFNVLSENRVVAISNADMGDDLADPATDLSRHSAGLPVKSMLDASVRINGALEGVICIEECRKHRQWSAAEEGFVASLADLVAQLIILHRLRYSESHYRALFEGSADGIMVLNQEGYFVDCNDATLKLFGCERSDILFTRPSSHSPEYQADGQLSMVKAKAQIDAAMRGITQSFEWQHLRADGEIFNAEVKLNAMRLGEVTQLVAMVRDVSDRKRAEQEIQASQEAMKFRAYHDSLTGLPNRDAFYEEATELLGHGAPFAVCLLDLNNFKAANDSLGHKFGDRLLNKVALRLIRFSDARSARAFRLGGDEFAVILQNFEDQEAALDEVDRLLEHIASPAQLEGITLQMGASVGIAFYPEHGEDSHALLRCADVAMYHAKHHGLGQAVFEPQFDVNDPNRLTLMTELSRALKTNQLNLYYQPRIDITTGRCVGCEALLRWHHPEKGFVPPGDFIPMAEVNDIIHPLTQWVIRSALQQAYLWYSEGHTLVVSVNISARNLIDMQFPAKVKMLLEEFELPPHLLELEITESALILDPQRAMVILNAVNDMGVMMAIDDFGTGYSSLSYLKRLPVDVLKVDQAFVRDLLSDDSDALIVSSTIDLAHSFGLVTVAEGVEDQATLERLWSMGCDQAQGYHLARPLPVEAFNQWLAEYDDSSVALTVRSAG